MNNIGSVAVSLLQVKICSISARLRMKATVHNVMAKSRINVNLKYLGQSHNHHIQISG